MSHEIEVFLTFGFLVVVVSLALYLAARILYLFGDRPLPGSQSRLVNITVVSLVAVISVSPLLGVELLEVYRGIQESVLAVVEALDIAAVLVVGLTVLAIFVILRRKAHK